MIPKELYNRRHFGTPWLFSLFIADAIAVCLVVPFFRWPVNWIFWAFIVLLAVYNFFTIRRNREDFNRISIISYIIFLLILMGGIVLILYRG